MAESSSWINPKNGFCTQTKTFYSLKPLVSLPPQEYPLSVSEYALSLLHNSSFSPSQTIALVDFSTGERISYSQFIHQTQTLASSLQNIYNLSKGDTAFVLSPNTIQIPILFFSLLSIGAVISPANPTSTISEVSRQIKLCNATIAFATSQTSSKILPAAVKHGGIILLDSAEFRSMVTIPKWEMNKRAVEVIQSDPAAILYSSGTTGKVKGVVLTHRNLTSVVAGSYATSSQQRLTPAVVLYTVPYFHIYGFFYSIRSVAMAETSVVFMEKFDLGMMMKAVEECRVTTVALSPPIVVAMVKDYDVIINSCCDLTSLEGVGCGGAPLGKEVIERFTERFPNVVMAQGYGLTESTGAAFRANDLEESRRYGSAGTMISNCEAKIIDRDTDIALPPCQEGELCIRGPHIMKGFAGDEEATAAMLDSEGWLRTGDLCYIDSDGFLFVVDRLKELIKYKGYQVAPAELEQLLQSHPEIRDTAVVPYPDERAGQIPMAFVVRQPHSNIDEHQIIEFIAKQVAPYKKIRRVALVDSIPKNAAGKILRKELINLSLNKLTSKL